MTTPFPAEEGGRPMMVRPHVYTCPEGTEWRCVGGVLEARVEKDEEDDEDSMEFCYRATVELEERFTVAESFADNDGWLAFLAKHYPQCVPPARAAIADPITRAEADADDARRLFPLAFPASVVSSEEGGRACDCFGKYVCVKCEVRAKLDEGSVVGDASEGEAEPIDARLLDSMLKDLEEAVGDITLSVKFDYDDREAYTKRETALAGIRELFRSTRAALEEARRDSERYASVIRWALGEEGDFVATPDHLSNVIQRGRAAIQQEGKLAPLVRLYWWRSELRRRAFGDDSTARAIPSQESTTE